MITLFGATGFTGQLIAATLDQQNTPFRLAGRSKEKLTQLSASLQNKPSWIIADATQPATLPALFAGSQVLINCAGPFTDLGEKVITQAAMSGSVYLDITNELGYFFRVRGFHEMASRTGAALVPACGFEVALADCAAALIAQKIGQENQRKAVDEIDVVYQLGGNGSSSGTRRSVVRSLATSWITYREGRWTGIIPGSEVKRFDLPAGNQFAFNIPSCESVTIPAHIETDKVEVWMTTSRAMQFWAPFFIPLLARASRSILRDPIVALAGRGGWKANSAIKKESRENSPFSITVTFRQGDKNHWMEVSGTDPYLLTAKIITYAAMQLVNPTGRKKGFLAPSQALDPQDFFDAAEAKWNIVVNSSF
jgi:short subunit dehydrogenase-like uncharacterized protein